MQRMTGYYLNEYQIVDTNILFIFNTQHFDYFQSIVERLHHMNPWYDFLEHGPFIN